MHIQNFDGGGGGIRTRVQNKSNCSHSQVYLIYYHKLEKIGSLLNRAYYPVALHLSSSDQGIHCDFFISQDLYLLF